MTTPQEQMSRMLTGYWVSQALYAAAKLKLADLLKNGPRTSDELAGPTGTHAPSLYRLLRALASVGVFVEDDRRRFGLTPLAECLRSDVPGSQWAMAVMNGEEHYASWGELLHSVRTGQPAFEKLFGAGVFDFLSRDPEKARIFDEAMVGVHGRETAAMLDSYHFSGVGVLADIGGGNGSLLSAVLKRYPNLRGLLFDLPGVSERARANLASAGLAGRCDVIGGNFFDAVASGADAYLLRHILHDWDDEECVRILKNVRAAMSDGGRLLV